MKNSRRQTCNRMNPNHTTPLRLDFSVLRYEPGRPDQPAIALWNSTAPEAFDATTPEPGVGERSALKQQASESWENEGGEVPNVPTPQPAMRCFRAGTIIRSRKRAWCPSRSRVPRRPPERWGASARVPAITLNPTPVRQRTKAVRRESEGAHSTTAAQDGHG